MSFNIQLGSYSGEKNRINKNISLSATFTGTLREGSDIVNPAILIEASADAVCGFNYAYIPEFKRYYYIQNTESYRNSLTVVTMSVDVLMTYKETILNSPAIIVRSSKVGDAVYSLPDERLPVLQSETTHVITFDSLYSNESDPTKGQSMILIMTGIDEPTNPSP